MKKYLTGLQIKLKIIKVLKENSVSLRRLETKCNVGYSPILRHTKELEALGIIKIKKTKENSRNGRAYSVVELTEYGKGLYKEKQKL